MHVLQRNHRFRSLLSFWATAPLQSLPLSPLFVRHTHAQTPSLQPQNPWLSHFFTLCPPHLEQSPPRHQALCYSLFLQKQTQDIRRHFSSQNISAKQHCPSPLSVCTVCVCASFAYLRLNLCLHYVLSFSFFLIYIFFKLPIAFLSPCTAMMMMHFLQTYAWTFVYIMCFFFLIYIFFIADNISISMYLMCVILP